MTDKEVKAELDIPVAMPVLGKVAGIAPIVVIGPNGAGKSRLMRAVTPARQFVSAQRRTYLNERLQSYATKQATNEFNSLLNSAHSTPWEFSNEIDSLFSRILTEHYSALYKNNQAATKGEAAKSFVADTTLVKLEQFWQSVFVNRKLSFEDFTPSAYSTADAKGTPYPARSMSDGERACLYLAARVMTAEPGYIVIDEPELHMHKKLAVDYWNTLEAMRPDLRFVYITHDLHFAISRKSPIIVVVRDEKTVEAVEPDAAAGDLAEVLLGAATLAINAKRIIFFEGVSGKGVANALFKKWIVGPDTSSIGVGSRDQVIAAGTSFGTLGVVKNAVVISLIDRDHGPEEMLSAMKAPAQVLALHEIESVFALPEVLRSVAKQVAYTGADPWQEFLGRARQALEEGMPKAVAQRVRARFDFLLHNSFTGALTGQTVQQTKNAHSSAVQALALDQKIPGLFDQEEAFIRAEMEKDDQSILTVLSGKRALAVAAETVGVPVNTYTDIVLDAIGDSKHQFHQAIVNALTPYLPPRA